MAMTRVQKITLGVLCVSACGIFLILLSIASQVYQAWSQQPLGPTLAFPTPWALPATWTASPGAPPPTVTLVPTLSTETATPGSPFLACNGLPTMTVLAIGTDVRPGEHRSGLTDLIRAVHVDFLRQTRYNVGVST